MDFRSMAERSADLESAGNEWGLWVFKAQELLASAGFLRELCPVRKYFAKDNAAYLKAQGSIEHKASRVVPMLLGMAAECFLKAIWLKAGNVLIENGQYPKIPKTTDHQLDTLALALSEHGHFSFSDDEVGLLFRLSSAITSGRYPVPKNAQTRNAISPAGTVLDDEAGEWRYPDDDKLIDSLFLRMWMTFKGDEAT